MYASQSAHSLTLRRIFDQVRNDDTQLGGHTLFGCLANRYLFTSLQQRRSHSLLLLYFFLYIEVRRGLYSLVQLYFLEATLILILVCVLSILLV
jgi:hypothetical protein